ncbi:hypothetical protein Q5424_08360 [Conexibacter sp. JD483]|uniref:hypothetical protein n=1 Tax=unclassified Conexibacter TaxID=2627773 RepID=UPI002726D381|nr:MULTISPECIES: hypothetical protein [unclassified Conexibacter]MDO8183949.1 hypothetical protein [Conexibacter sp. CPCC 205706]MDO8196941.1 hypothetical protein [Conexibacter sp. CPCC 205762]MDR9369089.1 hypothetical protein [Conexibacter sp. JD483]
MGPLVRWDQVEFGPAGTGFSLRLPLALDQFGSEVLVEDGLDEVLDALEAALPEGEELESELDHGHRDEDGSEPAVLYLSVPRCFPDLISPQRLHELLAPTVAAAAAAGARARVAHERSGADWLAAARALAERHDAGARPPTSQADASAPPTADGQTPSD